MQTKHYDYRLVVAYAFSNRIVGAVLNQSNSIKTLTRLQKKYPEGFTRIVCNED